jgi:hypothetical protein
MEEGLFARRLIEHGAAAERARAKKQARRERMESERLARLERLKQLTTSTRTSPRWMMASAGRWTWFEYSAEAGTLVDTGIEPVPGVPLPQQRPAERRNPLAGSRETPCTLPASDSSPTASAVSAECQKEGRLRSKDPRR